MTEAGVAILIVLAVVLVASCWIAKKLHRPSLDQCQYPLNVR